VPAQKGQKKFTSSEYLEITFTPKSGKPADYDGAPVHLEYVSSTGKITKVKDMELFLRANNATSLSVTMKSDKVAMQAGHATGTYRLIAYEKYGKKEGYDSKKKNKGAEPIFKEFEIVNGLRPVPTPADSLAVSQEAQADASGLTAAKIDAKNQELPQIPANWDKAKDGNYLNWGKDATKIYNFVVAHEDYVISALKEKYPVLATKTTDEIRSAVWTGAGNNYLAPAYKKGYVEIVNKAMGY
jgi:hypothetical protein